MDQIGSYRLRKRLAVGGMGEVYLGEKVGPEGFLKPVVLKCVLPQLAKDRAFVNLFLDEARLAALLNHPNIAQIYDFGFEDGVYFIAMEYVPGYTVDEIRRKLHSIGQFLPLQHVACIASQVCQGLHYAHALTDAGGDSLGLVHRDVSPHNLIVSLEGSVKIVDFGIAKARAGLTRVQARGAVGKFGYMSPEQARGEQVDGRSDIFSLGVCLWELATNERLHDPSLDKPPGYTPARPMPGVELHRAEVPRQFGQILETALSIIPDDRYPSARDMHLALERFQAAMTHYAGQAALAQYISDLVAGRVENPEPVGGVVEPAGHRSSNAPAPTEALEGARAYEEVFGVSLPSDRPRPRVKAVPDSWKTPPRRQATPVQRTVEGQQRLVDLSGEPDTTPHGVLELAGPRPSSRGGRSAGPAIAAPRRRTPSLGTFLGLVVVAGLVGVAYFAAVNPTRVAELTKSILPPSAPPLERTSVYRVTSEPEGARVLLDGEARGVTPLEVELIPEVTYRVRVELEGRATKEAEVRAALGTEVRPLRFQLEKAGTLTITSDPPGATVAIEGRNLDGKHTPLTLRDAATNAPLEVTVSLPGRPPQKRSVRLKPGRARSLRFRFD